LVIAGAALVGLGIGFNALSFIYVAMLCAGVAGVALVVFARLAQRRAATTVGAQVIAGRVVASSPVTPGGAADDGAGPDEPQHHADDDGTAEAEEDAARGRSEDPTAATHDDGGDDFGGEVVFPIDDYDELGINEILPLLPELDPHALQEVRDREVARKGRAIVLGRIDGLAGHRPAVAWREGEKPESGADRGAGNEGGRQAHHR
jgi:hypothetical protein